jgi:hypothetical protein
MPHIRLPTLQDVFELQQVWWYVIQIIPVGYEVYYQLRHLVVPACIQTHPGLYRQTVQIL